MVFEADLKGKIAFLYLSLYLIFAKACISAGKGIVRGVKGSSGVDGSYGRLMKK